MAFALAAAFILIIGCSKTQTAAQITGKQVKDAIPNEKNNPIEVYFCPQDNCGNVLISLINASSKSAHCAFFDIDIENTVIDATRLINSAL